MTKYFVAIALAVSLWIPGAAAEGILQRSDGREKSLATYVPAPPNSVPWLNIDRRNKWPKADFPIGREVNVAASSAFGPTAPTMRVTANSLSRIRRM